jgi:hypothetical protein
MPARALAVSGVLRLAALAAHFPDHPFDQKANTGGFEFVGLMPARA